MDFQQGQIWYERALFYGHNGEEKKAKKAYSIALHFDPGLPPLPKFRNHHLLKRLEQASLIAALLIVGWLIYLLFLYPLTFAHPDLSTRIWGFEEKHVIDTQTGEG